LNHIAQLIPALLILIIYGLLYFLTKVLVPMGNAALRQLSEVLNFEAPPPSAIGQAMGNSYIGKTEKGTTVTLCPIQHLSYPPIPSWLLVSRDGSFRPRPSLVDLDRELNCILHGFGICNSFSSNL